MNELVSVMNELMSIKPVVLWSDVLIYILVVSLGLFFYQLSKNPLARQRWRTVFHSRAGVASFIVILFYLLIALGFPALPRTSGKNRRQR